MSSLTVPNFTIDWGARSRDIEGPSSALSATVTLSAAGVHGSDVNLEVDRLAAPAAYSQAYALPAAALLGSHPCSVKFYSQAAAGGSVVASAQANVTIAANGTGIGSIATTGTVASVLVTAGQTVTANQTQLVYSAKDSIGDTLALSPGAAFWTLVDGAAFTSLTPDGLASPIASGTAHVEATVDGVASGQSIRPRKFSWRSWLPRR